MMKPSLILLILIAFGLRVAHLDGQSLWYDEGVTWLLSQMPTPSALIRWTAADIQPPFYYLLIWLTTRLFGDSEFALRFPSVIAGTLTVPLIAVLAVRLFRRVTIGQIAALLTALSPVMVYYSQEARMYTLLVAQAILATYLLLKSDPKGFENPLGLSVLYVLVATTALYTHYFAAFLILTHALYWLICLRRATALAVAMNGQQLKQLHSTKISQYVSRPTFLKHPIWHGTLLFGGVGLLFTPWLPTLLARWGDDPSYWQGALKLDEAVRKIGLNFTIGETVHEQTGVWLMLIYLSLLSGCLIYNLRRNSQLATRKHDSSTLPLLPPTIYLLLIWLILPILAILALSYQSPKFNPRYTLIAWPAFILIVAGIIGHRPRISRQLREHQQVNGGATQPSPNPSRGEGSSKIPPLGGLRGAVLPDYSFTFHKQSHINIVSRVTLAIILAMSLYSLSNWFTRIEFAKDDWRALAQFVRERQAADETVLLSSGHAYPVWAYYYGWQNWTPLPDTPTLDVNQILGVDVAQPMYDALRDKGGVWLVNWQDEVVDPNGMVEFWLDWVGERPQDGGDFWGLQLEHWRLTAVERLRESPIAQPTALNFDNRLRLRGLTQLSDREVIFFWQATQPLPDDLIITLDLVDAAGHQWATQAQVSRLGSPFYPPTRWPVGETIISRHELAWRPSSPPNGYVLTLEIGQTTDGAYHGWDILDEQGRPQRRIARLAPLHLRELTPPSPKMLSTAPLVDLATDLRVQQLDLPRSTAESGDRLPLAVWWRLTSASSPSASSGSAVSESVEDTLRFVLIDSTQTRHLVSEPFTVSRSATQTETIMLTQHWLTIPPDAATGQADLTVSLAEGTVSQTDNRLANLEILPTTRHFTPPPTLDIPLADSFGEQITLLGLSCAPTCSPQVGQSMALTFHWQAERPPQTDYTVFAHLLDSAETVIINRDHAPPKPTRAWVTGEVVSSTISLDLPTDLPSGEYAFEVGWYDAADPTFARLLLPDGGNRRLLTGFVRIPSSR